VQGDPYETPYTPVGKGSFPSGGYSNAPPKGSFGAAKGKFPKGGFPKGARRPWDAPLPPLQSTKSSALVAATPEMEEEMREAMILAILVTHPSLMARVESRIERLKLHLDSHDRIRHLLLGHQGEDPKAARERLDCEGGWDLETLLSRPHVRSAPPILKSADSDLAYRVLAEELAKLESRRAMRAEVADAARDLGGLADEGVTWRLSQAANARHKAERTDFDADGGGEDQEAKDRAKLRAMIEGEIWRKK
jgi:DNA primase